MARDKEHKRQSLPSGSEIRRSFRKTRKLLTPNVEKDETAKLEDDDEANLEAFRYSLVPRLRPQVALWRETMFGGVWLVTGGIIPHGNLIDCAVMKKTWRCFILAAVLHSWMTTFWRVPPLRYGRHPHHVHRNLSH